MTAFAPANLSGFDHHLTESCFAARPEKTEELERLIRETQRSYIPRGAGRGLADCALNRDGGVVFVERLDRLLDFDSTTGTLLCEGGCTLARIIDTFLPRGWFPLVTPGTRQVTVGGAIAADVHGKNHHRDGAFASCVNEFELLTATGETLRCSRNEHADVFWATLGGMGLTGTILTARIRLRRVESAFMTVQYEQSPNLDQTLRRFAATDSQSTYSVAWIDCLASGDSLGRSVLMRGEHATNKPLEVKPRRQKSIPFSLPSFVLSPLTVKAFNARFYRKHSNATRLVDYETYFYPLDAISNYYRLYGKRGFVQYQAVLPKETSHAGLAALLFKLSESKRASFLAVLKSMGRANEGLLSFPMEGHTLALDMPYSPDLVGLVRELDQIVVEHRGRVYLAKDAFLGRDALERMYPRLPDFLAIKSRLDPQGKIKSSMARRLGLVTDGGQ
jgi:FAD/FMN-containing dehydrogenase